MLSDDELEKLAINQCDQHINKLIDAKLDIQTKQGVSTWDPILRRHIYKHVAAIWREFDQVNIKVSPGGRVVAFHDLRRFDNSQYMPLDNEEILNIARTSGLLEKAPQVETSTEAAKGMLSTIISHFTRGEYEKINFKINVSTKQVAAFEIL